jgi:hypothetical protein
MDEGWYLMSTSELERLLAARRGGDEIAVGIRLTTEEALSFRSAGNVPDDEGRWLRLVLRVGPDESVDDKRQRFEPDFLERPAWRRAGSKPVNVVPLRTGGPVDGKAWWNQDDVGDLEKEWRKTGKIAGLVVSADYRSFVLKTVVSLQRAGIPVTVDNVADSISRWLAPEEVEKIRAALKREEPDT